MRYEALVASILGIAYSTYRYQLLLSSHHQTTSTAIMILLKCIPPSSHCGAYFYKPPTQITEKPSNNSPCSLVYNPSAAPCPTSDPIEAPCVVRASLHCHALNHPRSANPDGVHPNPVKFKSSHLSILRTSLFLRPLTIADYFTQAVYGHSGTNERIAGPQVDSPK